MRLADTGNEEVDLTTQSLGRGSHSAREDGVCAMELVALMAGEPHSDGPTCTSPLLGALVRSWNDLLSDEERQRLLLPILPALIDTNDERDDARAWLCLDWSVRIGAPTWLELAGLTDGARSLRALPKIEKVTVVETMTLIEGVQRQAEDVMANPSVAKSAAYAALLAVTKALNGDSWDAVSAVIGHTAWAIASSGSQELAGLATRALRSEQVRLIEELCAIGRPSSYPVRGAEAL